MREVERMIEANPHIKRIWLQSGGGWVNQGWWLYKLIRDNEMDTFARDCWSACTLAFIGGKNRTLDFYGTGLGFHKVSRDGDITANSISAQGKWHRAYKNAGVKKWFLKKMFDASPYNMWHPTRNELIDAGVVTQQP